MKNYWVRTWRLSEGWSAAMLAQRAGVPLAVVEAIERGQAPERAVAERIRSAVHAARRARGAKAIRQLMHACSQSQLERLLGLSQGYLSRLAGGAGNPSAALVALLTLLAHNPSRISELAQSPARSTRARGITPWLDGEPRERNDR